MKVAVLGAAPSAASSPARSPPGRCPVPRWSACHHGPVDPPTCRCSTPPAPSPAADLLVEAAGHAALAGLGPSAVAAGTDLLAVSAGALADAALLAALSAGPGRVHLCTGAVGGLDVLGAAARMGAWTRPHHHDRRPARCCPTRHRPGPVELRRGPAREIAAAFPKLDERRRGRRARRRRLGPGGGRRRRRSRRRPAPRTSSRRGARRGSTARDRNAPSAGTPTTSASSRTPCCARSPTSQGDGGARCPP